MIGPLARAWPLALALVALLTGWTVRGWYSGAQHAAELQGALTARVAAERAAHAAAEVASTKEAARLAAEADRDALARQLEDLAHADTDQSGGLSRARVERLRQR